MKHLGEQRSLAKPLKTALASDYAIKLIDKKIITPDQQSRAVAVFEQHPKFFDIVRQGKFDLVKAEKFLQLSQDVSVKPHLWSSKVQVNETKLSIAVIRSYGNNDDAISAISGVLIDFSASSFGVALDNSQVLLIATRIAEDYYFLSLDDLRTCLMRGITGQYRQGGYAIIYGAFNLIFVMEWLGDYVLELTQAAERIAQEKSSKQKGKGAMIDKSADGLTMPDFIKQTAEKMQRTAEIKEVIKSVSARLARAKENARKAQQVVTFCKDRLLCTGTTKAQALELETHLAQKTGYLNKKAIEIEALQMEYNAILQSLEKEKQDGE